MHTWLEISSSQLCANFKLFERMIGHERLAPVIKSNAYGHGLKEVYDSIQSMKPSWLVVNYVQEGIKLRAWGFQGRVLVVGPFVESEMIEAARFHLEMHLGHWEGLQAWLKSEVKPSIHLEFDTGMSRQGFKPEEAEKIATKLLDHKKSVSGICMHFANVEDVTEHAYATLQLNKFDLAKKYFKDLGFMLVAHAASSASTLILDESRFELCRVGISIYGFWPSQATKISFKQLHDSLLELKPVLSWRTLITSINHVSQGQFIGYGCTFKARHDMKIAILPVGYFEGYPRSVSGSSAYVLVQGQQCPIVGRICMNMMMVDVTDIAEKTFVGDQATLIGCDALESIHAQDVAGWCDTIHYELITRINAEIERRIL